MGGFRGKRRRGGCRDAGGASRTERHFHDLLGLSGSYDRLGTGSHFIVQLLTDGSSYDGVFGNILYLGSGGFLLLCVFECFIIFLGNETWDDDDADDDNDDKCWWVLFLQAGTCGPAARPGFPASWTGNSGGRRTGAL